MSSSINDSSAQGLTPKPTRIVCFGDSMTDGDTYPQIIMQSFRDSKEPIPTCICAGVGGDTAQMMNERFDKTVAIFKPEMVTVCEGTNDAFHNTSAEDYGKSIRAIVAKLKAIGARVMLLTPSECAARVGTTEAERDAFQANIQKHLDAYEAVIRQVASENSCVLAENRKLMKGALQEGKTLFVEDNVHPNYLGQSLMARSILNAMGRSDLELPKSFDPKPVPGLVENWSLRLSPSDPKGEPIHLTEDSVTKLAPDKTWTSCVLPEKEPLGATPEIWLEQMRRNGAVMEASKLIGAGKLGQGVAEVNSASGGPAYVQTGMGVKTVWLNGVKVHDQMNVWAGGHLGGERIPVTLNKGANALAIEFKDSFFLAVTPSLIWEDHLY